MNTSRLCLRLRPLLLGTRAFLSHLNLQTPLPATAYPTPPPQPPPHSTPSLPTTRTPAAFASGRPSPARFCTATVLGDGPENNGSKPKKKKKKGSRRDERRVDFTKVDLELLPRVILIGRPNVGKSALFNRLIRRREALVYNTPDGHVTRDIREGVAKLGDLRFRVLDSAGLETAASAGDVLGRTTSMTAGVLGRCQVAIFMIDVRAGLQPLDLEVGKWLRRNAPGICTILVMNKSESLDDSGLLASESAEAHALGFGDPIAISAETGLGMGELYETLRPLLEDHVIQCSVEKNADGDDLVNDDAKPSLQLAIVGRPNVGKSTLLNALLQEDRVLVGPEAGLTRDSIRAQFKFEERTVYLVDTAGWIQRSGQEKGPGSLSIIQSRKNLMRAHIIGLVLDAEEINGIPVVFVSALEGEGRISVMRTVVDSYEKWCSRLSTACLNRWLVKVMSRHSWKDLATQPKIKYFTQVKPRPPTFVAFVRGKKQLSDTDVRFLTKSLKEDFDLGGIPIRIMQRVVDRRSNR